MNKNTTFGNAWMHRQLIKMLRVTDVRCFYIFVCLFIMPVCLLLNTNHSRTSAYRYFRRHIGYGRWKSAWKTYVNHCMFGTVVIDRFAMFAGHRFELEAQGYEHLKELSLKDAGFMMLSSHIGCYEVAGYSLVSPVKTINALVYGGEKAMVMEGRKEKFSHNNIAMIPVRNDMNHLFKVNEALVRNEVVSMPADRMLGSSKSVEVDFLGGKVKLPMGPFSVATMRELDVLAVNVMRASVKKYVAYVTLLHYDKNAPRKQQIQQLADEYAKELALRVRQYPTQWYNFYDFWS